MRDSNLFMECSNLRPQHQCGRIGSHGEVENAVPEVQNTVVGIVLAAQESLPPASGQRGGGKDLEVVVAVGEVALVRSR